MSPADKDILDLILAKLNRIESEILEMKYPDEERIDPEIIERVKAAEKRILEGKGKKYSTEEFKKKFSLG